MRILDQKPAPNGTVYLESSQAEDLYEAIASLRVRAPPAIGIFAGYALYVLALQSQETQYGPFRCLPPGTEITSTVPAPQRSICATCWTGCWRWPSPCPAPTSPIQAAMGRAAGPFTRRDIAMCTAISEYGLSLVKAGDAFSPTATPAPWPPPGTAPAWAPLFLAKERGIPLHAWVMKPAPLQGARLTAYMSFSRPASTAPLICDNMASLVMKEGKINACFVGCDRVARNGGHRQ